MTTLITFQGKEFDLALCKGQQLIELHNAAASMLEGIKPVNKFADKATAIKRTLAVVQKAAEVSPKSKTLKVRKARGMRFVFPQGQELKKVREGTHRAKLVELLSRPEGATFEECLKATWGKDEKMDAETQKKTTYEAIRLIHYYVGYGMRQDAEGRITVFFTEK